MTCRQCDRRKWVCLVLTALLVGCAPWWSLEKLALVGAAALLLIGSFALGKELA